MVYAASLAVVRSNYLVRLFLKDSENRQLHLSFLPLACIDETAPLSDPQNSRKFE
jgi:hypothetical protein